MTGAPDVWQLTALELLSGYENGELSPVDVAGPLIERALAGANLNAFAAADFDAAAQQARAAETAWRTGQARPLEGLPFAAKDLFDSVDLDTAYGSRLFAGHRLERDGVEIRGLRAAGAIFLGKARTHEAAWG